MGKSPGDKNRAGIVGFHGGWALPLRRGEKRRVSSPCTSRLSPRECPPERHSGVAASIRLTVTRSPGASRTSSAADLVFTDEIGPESQREGRKPVVVASGIPASRPSGVSLDQPSVVLLDDE